MLASPSPPAPCNVVLLFKLPVENNERRREGRGVDCSVHQSYPFEDRTILSPIVS